MQSIGALARLGGSEPVNTTLKDYCWWRRKKFNAFSQPIFLAIAGGSADSQRR